MGAAELPAPRAEGSLSTRPFAHLLLYVQQQGLDGTLVVWPEQGAEGEGQPRGQDRVLILGGRPSAGRFVHPASSLDRSMLPLFTRVNAPYAFYDTDLVGTGPGVVTGSVDPLHLITASLRGAARDDAIDSVLRRLGMAKLRLRTGANLGGLGLIEREQSFVDLVRAEPATVSELVHSSGNERLARRMLYLLTITRSIEPFAPSESGREVTGKIGPVSIPPRGQDGGRVSTPAAPRVSTPPDRERRVSNRPHNSSRPGRGAPERAPPPPDALSDAMKLRWKEVGDRATAIEKQNYYTMLGLEKSTTSSAVRDAYFEQAKLWHPDRLPPELMPLRPWADRIFHHLTKAKDTLSDDKERATYLRAVESGGGTPESDRHVNAILSAAMEYQKAEVLVRRHDYAGALELIEDAIELNADDPDFYALRGHCMFHKQGGEGPYELILESLDRALSINERHERANFTKGLVLKRRGDDAAALKLFRIVADGNPRHTEAVREVRLANMRGKKDSGGEKNILSKLFGSNPKK